MLQDIRDNAQGIVAKVIIGFIIVSFSLFGVDSLIGGGGPAPAATVNGEEITVAQLDRAIDLQKRQLMNRLGEGADFSMLDDSLLRGPALERLVQRQLLLQAADSASIAVSDVIADQAIVSMSQFQQDGQFSPLLYKNVLRTNGFTLAYFKQLVSADMVIQQLNSGLSGSNFATDAELAATAKIVGQKRSFRYFMLPIAQVSESVEISDEAIETFYSEHSEDYKTEDRVKLAYIEIAQKDFFESVADEDLRQAYELEMDSFKADEERRAAHILIEVNDQRNAEAASELISELAQKIASGDTFASLAEQFSDDTGSALNAGDLGYTKGDTFPAEFEEALFNLTLNQVSEPVLTDAGYHLIIATEIKAMEKPSFDDRKAVLQERLQLAAAEAKFVRSVEELRDRVFNSEDLAGPAKELQLELSSSDWLSRTSAQGLLANAQVLAAAYSSDVLEDGNNSEVIELAADHFVVVRVLEHDAPHVKPLAELRTAISEQLKAQEAARLALQLAEDAMTELKAGKTIEEIAKQHGYESQVVQDVRRNAPSVNRELLGAAFEMSELDGDSVSLQSVSIGRGSAASVAVLQLDKVVTGSVDDFSSVEQQGIQAELQRNYGQQSLTVYIDALQDAADIETL